MKTRFSIAMLLAVTLLVAGCQTIAAFQRDERAQLQAAQITFTGVVNTLTTLRADGKFSVATADKITAAIKAGNTLLDKWADTLKANGTLVGNSGAVLTEFDSIMATLAHLKTEAK